MAFDSQTGKCVASKKVKGGKAVEISKNEAYLQNKANGQAHIMPIYATCEIPEKDLLYHFMPLAGFGNARNLQEKLHSCSTLDPEIFQQVLLLTAKGILTGLSNLHKLNMVHLDVKLENFVLEQDGTVLLTDFGCVQETTGEIHHSSGDIRYFSPDRMEHLRGGPSTSRGQGFDGFKQDAWAAGVVLYELLIGMFPFDAFISKQDCLDNWTEEYYRSKLATAKKSRALEPASAHPLWELIDALLEVNPKARITPAKGLTFGCFKSLEKKDKKEIFTKFGTACTEARQHETVELEHNQNFYNHLEEEKHYYQN